VDGRVFMNFGWKGDLRHAALYNIKKLKSRLIYFIIYFNGLNL